MEWTGQQQIWFLLQSTMVGMMQGAVLDIVTGLYRFKKGRYWVWTDALFGPFAAVTTFFGALVIMDGQLHPLLIFGTFLGMLAEHVALGRFICAGMRKIRRITREGVRATRALLLSVSLFVVQPIQKRRDCAEKMTKKDEKQ